MPEKKLDKDAQDKVMSPEMAIVNSAVTQASALMEIAECINDMADSMEIIRSIEVRRALKDGILAPDEAEDFEGADKDEE